MKYNHNNLQSAKSLRSNMTKEEIKFWNLVRKKNFHNLKFKRQALIGNYIVDFLCQEKMLIIEIDGGEHNMPDNIEYDKLRTEYLNKEGYKVLRFWNNEIWNNIEGVFKVIEDNI